MRNGLRILLVGIASLLFVVGAVGIYSHQLRRSAERIVRTSYEFSKRDYAPTLDDLRQQFGSELKQPDQCTASGCKYEVTLSNRALARLHLFPYSALSSSFWVKDNSVQENDLSLWTSNREGRMILAYVDTKYCESCNGFDVVPCEGDLASVASASVSIGSGPHLEQKRAAFAFNASCLTSLRGCSSVADLAPAIWRGTTTGALRCRAAQNE
jgi:hypothetical protein